MSTPGDHPTEALLDGRYRLGPRVGLGGTAEVYRAEDLMLGRSVAIKLLLQAERVPSTEVRVRSETAMLASLNHPSLVTLYDARLDPTHQQYLAMEYVDGPSLATRLDSGPLTGAEVAMLAVELGDALQVVHDAGIIHRDVKPSNVLLAPPQRRGRPWTAKLTDFGIAFGIDDARLTSPGIVVGTAAYMAPEQVRGAELTPAVDVYSLGLVLLEALTGEPAFPVDGSVQTALRRLSTPPTIPAGIGSGWTELLTRMTRLDPEGRPKADEIAHAARVLRDETPTQDYPVQATSAASKAGVRSRYVFTAPTRQFDIPPAPAAAKGVRHRRRGALVGMSAIALLMVVTAGAWTLAPMSDPAMTRLLVTPQPKSSPTEVAEPSAPAPDTVVTSTGSGTGNGNANNGGSSGQNSGQSDPNPNKGPGNNSGGTEHPPHSDKKK